MRPRTKGDLNAILGKVLVEKRKKASLSQEQLAFECELHPTYISQVERGLKSPTVRTLFKFAKAMDVKASELVKEMEKRM
ncbi:MAG TPA: helix-turn-helix transcriptional regulator [Candidatus Hydrogenedentes bacterium]|nr:helix-turn-helix transcriptional regulator [Candidatus Hydrogenedentota bacterium]